MAGSVEPRIYVACLASYNAGILYGKWIDADQDADVIFEEIAEMLAESPEPGSEEYAIHDHEGFHPYRVSEYESIRDVSRIAKEIVKHGQVFPALLNHLESLDDAVEAMENRYAGEWDSLEDYVEDSTRQSHEIPDFLEYYIDWKAMARDWELNGDIYTVEADRNVYVFSS